MATNGLSGSALSEASTAPQDITNASRQRDDVIPASTPVEMSSLEVAPAAPQTTDDAPTHLPTPPPEPTITPQDSTPSPSQNREPGPSPPAFITRQYSTAIGPSSDSPLSAPPEDAGPTLLITLLLTSGARHPFKLDAKYLQKRNVEVSTNDPFNLSVYKLKELILREWRDEWESKPASPSYIRLISFGKLLDDKAYLKDSRFNHDAPNVVHMTIKPQDYVEEEDTSKGGKASFGAGRDGTERSPGCRCLVM